LFFPEIDPEPMVVSPAIHYAAVVLAEQDAKELTALYRAMEATPILENMAASAARELAGQGTVRQYRKGSYLFFQGDASEHVLFFWKGRIEVSSISLTGRRQLLTTLDYPQFFGELGVLGQQDRTATALALEDSHVWLIDGERFLAFLGKHFEATKSLLEVLARQIQSHESFVEDLLFLDLKGRVAKRLLQLVSPSLTELPEDGTPLPSVVTHADLASLCGGSRENVTRILSEFQKRGLVARDGRRYILKNVTGLRRLAAL
jgi:CRP/FNR family transcriptional regulator, cyclic AMP receptor protein